MAAPSGVAISFFVPHAFRMGQRTIGISGCFGEFLELLRRAISKPTNPYLLKYHYDSASMTKNSSKRNQNR